MQHTINAETRYITSIEKESQWNLNVNTVGFEAIPAHSTYPTAGHPQGYYFDFEKGRVLQEFQMVYITRGKGMFVSKLKQEITVPEGSMFVLFPGEWHTYKPGDQTGWESYWVGFNGSFAQELLADKQSYISNPVLNIGYDEEIVSLYKKILEISANERPGYQNLLSGIVIHLLSYILYREKNKNLNDKEVFNKIDKARLIIREKLNTAISPEEIAASKSTLEKVNDYTNTVLETVNTPVLQTHNLKVKDKNSINWKVVFGNFALLTAFIAMFFVVVKRREKRKLKPQVAEKNFVSIAETEDLIRKDLNNSVEENIEYLKKLKDNKDFATFFSVYNDLVNETKKRNLIQSESDFRRFLEQNKGQQFADQYRVLSEQIQFERFAPFHSEERIEELFNSISTLFSEINK